MREGLNDVRRPLAVAPVPMALRETARGLINEAYLVERWLVDGERLSIEEYASLERDAVLLGGFDDAAALRACVFVQIDGERGYFGPLAVDPSAQRLGWGRQMVEAAETLAREQGCTVMELTIINLRTELPPFYRALGYAEAGTLPMHDPRKKHDCHFIVMRKSLR